MMAPSTGVRVLAALAGCLAAFGCTNDPYPEADRDKKVLYSSFNEAPKTLDPAVAYTTAEHVITGNVYDTLLEYHYLRAALSAHRRPRRGGARAAANCPTANKPTASRSARASCSMPIPASPRAEAERPTRAVDRRGFRFRAGAHRRPRGQQPRHQQLRAGAGLCRLQQAADRAAQTDKAFAALPAHEQYARAGGIEGVVAHGDQALEIVLAEPNAQILYWFAMPFTTPLAWEAVAYYDGKDGRRALRRPCRRHGTLSAFPVREAVPLHAGAQRAVVRQPANEPRRARAAFSLPDRPARTLPRAASMPPTPAGACPSSTA